MFFAIVFIAIGLALLLNTMGLMSGTFWGFFWAIFFIAVGIKMMVKRGRCPVCGLHYWEGKMHDKMHKHCCGHDHDEDGEEARN